MTPSGTSFLDRSDQLAPLVDLPGAPEHEAARRVSLEERDASCEELVVPPIVVVEQGQILGLAVDRARPVGGHRDEIADDAVADPAILEIWGERGAHLFAR